MIKLRPLWFTIALLGAGALWIAPRMPAVQAEVAPTAAATRAVVAPGRVEPLHEPVQLAFEAQGRIAELLVDEGDTVRQGQLLARLDDRLARARVAMAEAAVAEAEARYALARTGPRHTDVAALRAEADAAAADAEHRSAEQRRTTQLDHAGAVAHATADADDAAARIATARARAAAARFESLASGTRREQVAEAQAQVAGARAELEAARVALDQTRLVAPIDGAILRRTAELGALVTLTTPIPVLAMADLGKLELRAEIDEADLGAIRVGQTAYATADAFGDRRFAVRVTRVTRELGRKTVRDDDPRARFDTRVLEIIAQFDAPAGAALPLGLRMVLHLGG